MAKLPRPHIPIKVRCRVALRQLGRDKAYTDKVIRDEYGGFGTLLEVLLEDLADKLGTEPKKLHLDHDPALENRQQYRLVNVVYYTPDANDPDYLIYREGGFRGSEHDVKTRVRGARGQFADNVIAKRGRKRKKKLLDIATQGRPSFFGKGRKLRSRNNLRRKK